MVNQTKSYCRICGTDKMIGGQRFCSDCWNMRRKIVSDILRNPQDIPYGLKISVSEG